MGSEMCIRDSHGRVQALVSGNAIRVAFQFLSRTSAHPDGLSQVHPSILEIDAVARRVEELTTVESAFGSWGSASSSQKSQKIVPF